MSDYTVLGKVKMIGATESFGTNGFRKRNIVVVTSENYPQMIQIEFVQDKVDLLDNFAEGQDVEINVNLRGREWINPKGEAVYFNTIQGWGIKLQEGSATTAPPVDSNGSSDNEPDDLPF